MSKSKWDAMWINAGIATCEENSGFIANGALAIQDGKITWVGEMQALSDTPDNLAVNVYDVNGFCITPGFIDCHTHIVYAGNRVRECALRLEGASYADIAKQGGGIQATVAATRQISEDELFKQSLIRIQALMKSGITTLEIKSGYGLEWTTELKMLRVIKHLANSLPLTIHSTFLGAHTIPLEYRDYPDKYVDLICHEMLPKIAEEKLANAVDVFCENIAFNVKQTERIFSTAKKYGLNIKCHAEQLSDSGSAALAARYQALSVDHLEYISEEGIKAIAQSGTVAVLLPGAFYFLREKKLPPINLLRQYQVPIAIATDCNPGTSPITSILLILNMACVLFNLTPEEALLGVTLHAAKALGLAKTHGTLEPGKVADFIIWKVKQPAELVYWMGGYPLHKMIKNGVEIPL